MEGFIFLGDAPESIHSSWPLCMTFATFSYTKRSQSDGTSLRTLWQRVTIQFFFSEVYKDS